RQGLGRGLLLLLRLLSWLRLHCLFENFDLAERGKNFGLAMLAVIHLECLAGEHVATFVIKLLQSFHAHGHSLLKEKMSGLSISGSGLEARGECNPSKKRKGPP